MLVCLWPIRASACVTGYSLDQRVLEVAYSNARNYSIQAVIEPEGVVVYLTECYRSHRPVAPFPMAKQWSGFGIPFGLSVDDDGNFSFSVSTSRVNSSSLFLNGKLIEPDKKNRLFSDTLLSSGLLYSSLSIGKKTYRINKYDLQGKLLSSAVSKNQIIAMHSASKRKVVFTGFDVAKLMIGVFELSFTARSISELCTLPCLGSPDGYVELGELTAEQRLWKLASWFLKYFDNNSSLTYLDNKLGRLSWSVSYRLDAIVELLGASHNFISVIERNNLLRQFERSYVELSDKFINRSGHIGFPTTKYSIDKRQRLSLMVNNAVIMIPLLKGIRLGLILEPYKSRIISQAEQLFKYYEQNFIDLEHFSGYVFQRGIPFKFDGIPMPFNQQNLFGIVLLELFDITGDSRYYERASQLALAFRRDFIWDSGGIVWNYWPDVFYQGWSEGDFQSLNKKEKKRINVRRREDTGHASFNLHFVIEYYERFPEVVFTYDDIVAIRGTLAYGILSSSGSAKRLVPPGDYEHLNANPVLLRNRWLDLDCEGAIDYSNGALLGGPYFEHDYFALYANALVAKKGRHPSIRKFCR
jgi:hypothetical protein